MSDVSSQEAVARDAERCLTILGVIWAGEHEDATTQELTDVTLAVGLDVRDDATRLAMLMARLCLKLWRNAQAAEVADDATAPLAALRVFAQHKAKAADA